MKFFFIHILLFLTLLLTIACGEDRTYEYEEKTRHSHWMLEMMQDRYLWADSLKNFEPTWKNYFAEPEAFLEVLVAPSKQGDEWSYVEIDTLQEDSHERGYFSHRDSYGLDFVLMTDPTGQTTRQVLRVVTVYPGSPAERAGLKRNDFICSYNGYKFSKSNVSKLQKGVARQLEVRHVGVDAQEGIFFWEDTLEVSLGASEYVEDVPFPVWNVVEVDDVTVGYVMCTRLVEYPIEKESLRGGSSVYREAMDAVMREMKDAGVDELVLDLRLCNYGTLEMAQRLASYVVSPDARNDLFATTFWNERYTGNNSALPYDVSLDNLGLSRIYILTSSYTQGAAEWLIHGLRYSMGEEQVITIGTETKGQNVMTAEVGNQYYVHLFPVVAYVGDGGGDYEYDELEPTIEVDEFGFLSLDEYGSENETLFATAIQHILGLIGQNDGKEVDSSDKTSEEEGVE